jgi:hypothetical protein
VFWREHSRLPLSEDADTMALRDRMHTDNKLSRSQKILNEINKDLKKHEIKIKIENAKFNQD